jgi:flagellar basal body-associated protein FliL
MIHIILILAAVLGLAVLAVVMLWKSRKALKAQAAAQAVAIEKQAHIIKAMEAAYGKANKRKDNMASGSDANRFDASLGVLHDVAGGDKPAGG